ncbi:MAG: hypothetical protein JSV80_15655 [Acidobacteriota bacterium]|nr:MAG: hypothetical protein JSV80_15655 [Acidobacteriota bacterium]
MRAKWGWFVVHTQPRKEFFVRERVEDLQRRVFLPLAETPCPRRLQRALGPLFPGYLFAQLSVGRGDLAVLRWMHGVKRILGDGENPLPIDRNIVREIRARADRTGRIAFGRALRAGQRVRVLNGPLVGLEGVLDGTVTRPEERVAVLLEIFERATRAVLPARELLGLDDATNAR